MVNLFWHSKNGLKLGVIITTLLFSGLRNIQAREKPNIVLLYIDDMGWKDVEYNGNSYAKTPNINKLASEGMTFTNAYANAPNCAPSRACMLSGQYTPRHGVYTVNNSDQGAAKDRRLIPVPNPDDFIPDSSVTIAEALNTVGYVSASIGKWHIGNDPTTQGFNVNIAGNGAGSLGSGGFMSPYNNLPNLPNGPNGEYLTDRLTDEALKFIDDNKNTTFFLYLTHYAVHTPITGKPDKVSKYKNLYPQLSDGWNKYLAMIESVDESVERVIAKLKQLNLEDNTIAIFYSDNGGHPAYTSMKPLKGTKGMLYEGGIRVPFICKWPGHVEAGSTCDVTIAGTDLYPTFLEISGAQVPQGYVLDGESIIPLLTQSGSLNREAIYFHSPIYLRKAYSQINYRFRETPSSAMIKGPWKMIEFFETGDIELYNIRDDISESKELAEFLPDTVAMLYDMLESWRKSTNAPMTPEKNPQFVRLFDYKNLPKKGQVFDAGNSDSMTVTVSGDCMSNEIDSVILRIFHNATLYRERIQKTSFSGGKAPFSFKPKLAASKKPYKFKVYFIRKVITEIDTIVKNVVVKNQSTIIDYSNKQIKKIPQIKITRNTADKSITITLQEGHCSEARLEVWNTKGRLLYSAQRSNVTTLHEIITLSEKALGIYFLRISVGNFEETRPIVISK